MLSFVHGYFSYALLLKEILTHPDHFDLKATFKNTLEEDLTLFINLLNFPLQDILFRKQVLMIIRYFSTFPEGGGWFLVWLD